MEIAFKMEDPELRDLHSRGYFSLVYRTTCRAFEDLSKLYTVESRFLFQDSALKSSISIESIKSFVNDFLFSTMTFNNPDSLLHKFNYIFVIFLVPVISFSKKIFNERKKINMI